MLRCHLGSREEFRLCPLLHSLSSPGFALVQRSLGQPHRDLDLHRHARRRFPMQASHPLGFLFERQMHRLACLLDILRHLEHHHRHGTYRSTPLDHQQSSDEGE